MERSIDLPNGLGRITYRIPNVMEQMRFYRETKWFEGNLDIWDRYMNAWDHAKTFITNFDSAVECIDDVLNNRENLDCICKLILDVAGVKKKVTEEEKKP